jgi:hypothetical protein
MLGAVVAESERAVAFGAEETAHLAARVAMIDTQRLVGFLADGASATLPLQHRFVIGQGYPVDLPVALLALPCAFARALLVSKGVVGPPPDAAALVDFLLVGLAIAPPGRANLLAVLHILCKPFLVPRAVGEHLSAHWARRSVRQQEAARARGRGACSASS